MGIKIWWRTKKKEDELIRKFYTVNKEDKTNNTEHDKTNTSEETRANTSEKDKINNNYEEKN